MKYFILCAMAFIAIASCNPAKRFAGFGQIGGVLSSVGGNLGCVVTGNKLYINGLFEKNLTSGEQEEFSDYEQRLQDFKKEIRQVIAQRRQELLEQRRQNASGQQQNGGGMLSMENGNDETSSSSDAVSSSVSSSSNSSLPKPPQKPSFCSGDTTTQYIFDGCKVQVSFYIFNIHDLINHLSLFRMEKFMLVPNMLVIFQPKNFNVFKILIKR